MLNFNDWFIEKYLQSDSNKLQEMSIAKEGNAEFPSELLSFKTIFMLEKDWSKIGTIKDMLCFKHNNSGSYLMGKYNNDVEKFEVYLYIELTTISSLLYKQLGYDKVKYIEGITVKETNHGDGFATSFYKFLVKKMKYTLLSGEEQYFGARKLWTRLSKDIDVTVDIIDIKNKIQLDKDVVLHHGKYDSDFDNRVWSYSKDKKDIRLILTDIK